MPTDEGGITCKGGECAVGIFPLGGFFNNPLGEGKRAPPPPQNFLSGVASRPKSVFLATFQISKWVFLKISGESASLRTSAPGPESRLPPPARPAPRPIQASTDKGCPREAPKEGVAALARGASRDRGQRVFYSVDSSILVVRLPPGLPVKTFRFALLPLPPSQSQARKPE